MTALGLAGCSMGPNDLTLIDDVRVVTAIAEPPDALPGEAYTLTAVIAEPFGRPVDVFLWSCPLPTEPCVLVEPELEGDAVTTDAVAVTPAPVWIAACVQGLCAPPTEAEQRDPSVWLRALPLEGVNVASRLTRIREEGVEPHVNPVIEEAPPAELEVEAVPDPTVVDPVPLALRAPMATLAAGLTTAGGFSQLQAEVDEDGAVELGWYPPAEAGSAQLYVVVDDGLGGTALWRGRADVR